MKTHFGLPSGDYVIALSEEELKQLLEKGHLSARISRTPCTTSRLVIDFENGRAEPLDRKNVANDLRFFLREDVADLKSGDWTVQFLDICIEKNGG